MAEINVSLSDGLYEFVAAQVAARGFSHASEYVRALILLDAQTRWEAALLDGLEGEETELTHAGWRDLRAAAVAELAARRAAGR